MPSIQYLRGNLFDLLPKNPNTKIIPHVVNNIGKWNTDFGYSLANNYPVTKSSYLRWFSHPYDMIHDSCFELGQCQWIKADQNVFVVNMIALDGAVKNYANLKYFPLAQCMEKVRKFATFSNYMAPEIHMEQYYCSNWSFVESLVFEIWSAVPVIIYC